MAQLATLWRRSNLVILVTFKKGNHPGKTYVRRGPRKAFHQRERERDSLEGSQEEAEIQHKALRQRKNFAFSEDTCLEKERVWSKVTPRKVGVGLKWRRELNKRRLEWRLAWWGSGSLTFTRIERKTPVLRPVLESKQSSLCGLRHSEDREGGGPNGQIVSKKLTADGRRQRSRKIIDEEREMYRAKNGSSWNTSTDSKETTFVILINHASAPIRKERLSPTSKARREAS